MRRNKVASGAELNCHRAQCLVQGDPNLGTITFRLTWVSDLGFLFLQPICAKSDLWASVVDVPQTSCGFDLASTPKKLAFYLASAEGC